MNNFTFYSPTLFTFGDGEEKNTGALVRRFGGSRVLLVTGGGSVRRNGAYDAVTASLEAAGIPFTELSDVQANPRSAKAIGFGALYKGDFWDFFTGAAKIEKTLPVGVVLTISAAGSEGSDSCVITQERGNLKWGCPKTDVIRPKFAVLNPRFTCSLPAYQTASGAVDMMAHIMERYFTDTPDVEISDRLCEGTLTAIIKEAYRVKQQPDNYAARANIMWCGTVAHNGTCGVGREEDWASHALEHEISAIYNVAHGAGLAVIFPAWMAFMAEHNPAKIAQFAHRVFDIPKSEDLEEMALAGTARLKHFFRYMGLPVSFKELGIEHPDIDRMLVSLRRNKGELLGNYVKLTMTDCREIYRLAL